VQPLDEIALYARISSRPLMINWTEAAVALRDSYDQDNGRGKGILKVSIHIPAISFVIVVLHITMYCQISY
jgi:hypothetical protein